MEPHFITDFQLITGKMIREENSNIAGFFFLLCLSKSS